MRWRLWSTVPRAPAEKKSQPAAFLLFTLLREKHSRVLSRIYFPRWNTRSHSHRAILLTLLYAMLHLTLCRQLERYRRQVLEIPRTETFQRKMGGTSIRIIHLIYSDGFLNLMCWLVNGSHCFNSLPLPCCFFIFLSPPLHFYLSPETVAPPEKMLLQRIVPLLFVNNWFWALYPPAPLLMGMDESTQGAACVHRLSKRSLISLKRGRNTAAVCRSHKNTRVL